MTKNCNQCGCEFQISEEDLKFYSKMGATIKDILYPVSPPTLCMECRNQRRFAWKNERKFYLRKCDFSGETIVSLYAPNSPYTVYSNDIWWSEKWNPLDYGQDYSFSRSFFEQLHDLNLKVPKLSLINDNNVSSENCQYTSDFSFGKNCYFVFGAWLVEGALHTTLSSRANFSCDVMASQEGENLYECSDCFKCSNSIYLVNSTSSNDCKFCYDLKNCSNCIFCYGLRGKNYYIKNKPATKEEYERYVDSLKLCDYSRFEASVTEFHKILEVAPRKALNIRNCENSIGDYLTNCKNTHGFDLVGAEDSKYMFRGEYQKDSYDCSYVGKCEHCYENVTCDESFNAISTIYSWKNTNAFYSIDCHSCKNIFGCVSLRNVEYCILNKQYTKEEYEELVPKIIAASNAVSSWGEFFPIEFSSFAYNETQAPEYYPLTKEEVLTRGWKWRDEDSREYAPQTYIVPDSINEVSAEITKEILACNTCKKNYKITSPELAFYLRLKLPIPRKCPECRHMTRIKTLRNPSKLFERSCMKCGTGIKTSYSPERKEVVYCERCYQKEVY